MQDPKTILPALTREEILAIRPGAFGDYDLLDVARAFGEAHDWDREASVIELILRSPEVVFELIDYNGLYFDLVEYYRHKGEITTALQWAYARIAYDEQHEGGDGRADARLTLADIYLAGDDLDSGLALYTDAIRFDPGDIWVYNRLGLELPKTGLVELAAEVLRKGLALVEKSDPEGLKDQLRNLLAEAETTSGAETGWVSGAAPEVVADLRAALALPVSAEDPGETVQRDYNALPAGLADGAGGESAVAEALTAGVQVIPDLIRVAHDPDREAGSALAVSALRRFAQVYPDELARLSPWLDRAQGDWRERLLSENAGKVGGYTSEELRELAAEADLARDVRASAISALRKRVERRPAEREQTVALFRELLTRPEAFEASEEGFIASLVSECLDLGARELLPEIERTFAEDRIEVGVVDPEDIREAWGLPPGPEMEKREDGLYLLLECRDCGRTREHFTHHALVDTGTASRQEEGGEPAFDACILDHAVVCPKCGAVDRYRLTSLSRMRLLGPEMMLASLTGGKAAGRKARANPRVLYFRAAALGREMHPLEALGEYRRLAARRPDDAEVLRGMGVLLRTLLRYEEARQVLARAGALAPDDPGVAIARAAAEHDFGDPEVAREIYRRLLDREVNLPVERRGDEYTLAAMDGLLRLERGLASGYQADMRTLDGKAVEHPSKRVNFPEKRGAPRKESGKKTKRGRRGRR